ncbi:hypothetical protein Pelo_16063 [Pelomyxa schiedti]|nr:hypothetical protein Pelo_16063 [Pelomyxa schiedti]
MVALAMMTHPRCGSHGPLAVPGLGPGGFAPAVPRATSEGTVWHGPASETESSVIGRNYVWGWQHSKGEEEEVETGFNKCFVKNINWENGGARRHLLWRDSPALCRVICNDKWMLHWRCLEHHSDRFLGVVSLIIEDSQEHQQHGKQREGVNDVDCSQAVVPLTNASQGDSMVKLFSFNKMDPDEALIATHFYSDPGRLILSVIDVPQTYSTRTLIVKSSTQFPTFCTLCSAFIVQKNNGQRYVIARVFYPRQLGEVLELQEGTSSFKQIKPPSYACKCISQVSMSQFCVSMPDCFELWDCNRGKVRASKHRERCTEVEANSGFLFHKSNTHFEVTDVLSSPSDLPILTVDFSTDRYSSCALLP